MQSFKGQEEQHYSHAEKLLSLKEQVENTKEITNPKYHLLLSNSTIDYLNRHCNIPRDALGQDAKIKIYHNEGFPFTCQGYEFEVISTK